MDLFSTVVNIKARFHYYTSSAYKTTLFFFFFTKCLVASAESSAENAPLTSPLSRLQAGSVMWKDTVLAAMYALASRRTGLHTVHDDGPISLCNRGWWTRRVLAGEGSHSEVEHVYVCVRWCTWQCNKPSVDLRLLTEQQRQWCDMISHSAATLRSSLFIILSILIM